MRVKLFAVAHRAGDINQRARAQTQRREEFRRRTRYPLSKGKVALMKPFAVAGPAWSLGIEFLPIKMGKSRAKASMTHHRRLFRRIYILVHAIVLNVSIEWPQRPASSFSSGKRKSYSRTAWLHLCLHFYHCDNMDYA